MLWCVHILVMTLLTLLTLLFLSCVGLYCYCEHFSVAGVVIWLCRIVGLSVADVMLAQVPIKMCFAWGVLLTLVCDGTAAAVIDACLLQRYLPTGVVDDLLDNTSDVTVALGVVVDTELGGSLVVLGVSGEDTAALTLSSNDTTHGC